METWAQIWFGAILLLMAFVWPALIVKPRAGPRQHQPPAPANKTKEPSTLPKCLCEHWFVVHDAETFHCVHDGCKCQQYMGPDPVLSGLWMATKPMKKQTIDMEQAAS